jgi:predicted  nucleic acid-binding Zn-ribbon protein
VHADLQALLRLQDKDKVVLDIKAEMAALEPQIEELDHELETAAADLDAARTREDEADKRRADLEAKIETYRIMQERKRQKLEWVRGAKEASTLMAELDLARSVLAREEAEWVKSADRVSDAKESVEERDTVLQELKTQQAPKREELSARMAELDERLAAARSDRDEVAKGVAQDLQDRYERVLRGRAPLALYPVQSGACGHCFTAVPLHRRQKLLGGESIEACEACGVLLYHEAE